MTTRDDSGRGWRTTIAASIAIVLSAVPPFLIGALMPIIRRDLDIGTDQLGIVFACYYAVGALWAIPGGRLVERLGPRRGVLLGATLSTCSLLMVAYATRSWVQLLGAMALAGAANGMQHPGTNLAILREVPGARQGMAFGLKQAAAPTATLLAGSAVSAVTATTGWRWIFVAATALMPVIALLLPHSSATNTPHRSSRRAAPTRVLIRIAIAAGLGFGAATSLAGFLVDSVVSSGGSARAAGTGLVVASLACIAVRLAVGWYSDRTAEPEFTVVVVLLTAGAAGFVGLAVTGAGPLWPLAAIVALGAGWGWPGLLYHIVSVANPRTPASATAYVTVGNTVGGTLGPLAFGFVARHVSFSAGWSMSAAMASIAAVLLMPLGRRRFDDPQP